MKYLHNIKINFEVGLLCLGNLMVLGAFYNSIPVQATQEFQVRPTVKVGMKSQEKLTPSTGYKTPIQEVTETPTSEEAVARYLRDIESPDESVRVDAAQALHKMGHPRALEVCLKTLNDQFDILHPESTPAVWCLVDIGKPALLPLLDYLEADSYRSWIRAGKVFEEVMPEYFGYDKKQRRWINPNGFEELKNFWKYIMYNGCSITRTTLDFDWFAPPSPEQIEMWQRLRVWIETRE